MLTTFSLQVSTGSINGIKKEMTSLRRVGSEHTKKQTDVERKVSEQAKLLNEQNQKLQEQDHRVNQLTTSLSHCQQQLTVLYSEIARLRREMSLQPSDDVTRALNSSAEVARVSSVGQMQNALNVGQCSTMGSGDVLARTEPGHYVVDTTEEPQENLERCDMKQSSYNQSESTVLGRKKRKGSLALDCRVTPKRRALTRAVKKSAV